MALKKIYSGANEFDAHHIRTVLEAAGVRAIVFGEDLGIARGSLPLTFETLPTVWVDETAFKRAEAVLREVERDSRRQPADSWICPNCGEHVEPTFSQCWNCLADRPEIT